MTVGGSTSGSATTAPTGPLSRERVRASHQAIGVPMISSRTVVSDASWMVSQMASKSAWFSGIGCGSLQGVAERLDDRRGLRSLQILDERLRGRIVLALREDHRVLLDRLVQRLRHHPRRAARDLAVLVDLRQRHEAEFGIAGGDELLRLRDVLPFDDLRRDRLREAELVERLRRGEAVGPSSDWRWRDA